MKKLISLAISLLLALNVSAAAGAAADPRALYEAAMKKTDALSSLDSSTNMKGTISYGEESVPYSTVSHTKMVKQGSSGYVLEAEFKTEMSGSVLEYKTYYTDGYYYMDMMGQKLRMKMDLEAAKKRMSANGGMTDGMEYLSGFAMDGDRITYTMGADGLNGLVSQAMSAGGGETGASVTMSDFKGSAVIAPNGCLASETLSGSMTVKSGDVSMTMDMTVETVYNDPGQTVSIQLPDLSGYERIRMPSEYDDMFYSEDVIIL